uniref:Gustatory receptor n=1 Tax=Anopheles atroparvus TaxID=41427 RepID=A0A182JA38_ANOAO
MAPQAEPKLRSSLVPMLLSVVPVNTRASYVKQLLPTYTVLMLYSTCLVSIFWQSGNTSDISNAANWIQFAGCILYLSDRAMLLLRGMNNFPVGVENLTLQPQQHGHAHYKTLNMTMGGPHHGSIHEGKLNRLTTLANIKIRAISPLDSIQHIREVVELLQELAVKINHCFGKQAIFSLLSAFTCVTVQLYYMLNHIKSGFTAPRSEIYALASCSLLFLHGIEFWALFTSGEHVRLKWKKVVNFLFFMKSKSTDDDFRSKSRTLICVFPVSSTMVPPLPAIRGPAFRDQADDLISFMMSNPLEFNAYGLFPIDLSVLTGVRVFFLVLRNGPESIASSITTYLIVLIQFKISEEQTSGYDDDSNDNSHIQYSAT